MSFILLITVGCSKNTNQTSDSQTTTATSPKEKKATRTFIDSARREVIVPKNITKIAPSGATAQLVLYTSNPDFLVGLAGPFPRKAKEFVPKIYQKLPEFGQFYGKKANLNMEALSAAKPDVIIDIGEAKKTVHEDMDKLQNQLEIPVVFIEANLSDMPKTYKKIGELLGNTSETDGLSNYCEKVLAQAKNIKSELPESKQKTIYYASGNAGLNTNAEGSFHAQVIDQIGAKNAAKDVEVVSTGGGTVVSMEQLIQWQPDYIIADSKDLYEHITTDNSWQELTAVKQGDVYQIPTIPYNFMSSPPSVNRIIGIQWLGQLVYPESYQLDTKQSVADFYDLFYHVKPTTEQISDILENAQ